MQSLNAYDTALLFVALLSTFLSGKIEQGIVHPRQTDSKHGEVRTAV